MSDKHNTFEKEALIAVKNILSKFQDKFEQGEISLNEVEVNRTGSDEVYFSEIEIEFWKSNKLVDALSVILCMDGRNVLDMNQLDNWLSTEIEQVLKIYGGFNVN